MAKKTTLETLSAQMAEGFAKHGKEIHDLTESVAHVVKNMATKDDIAEIRRDMATKDQVIALHTQVNSMERQLRETRTESRLADLEEKVFRKVRA
jgi:ABC-type transporter Mla subunit MlaD